MFKLVTIKKKAEFALFRRQGNFLTSPFFIVKQYPNNLAGSQFGLVVSKKVSKLAVERNLVKRRIKAAVREVKPEFLHATNILLIAKNHALKAKYEDLRRDLMQIFRRLHDYQVNNSLNKDI